jgi:hypothetical protein
VVREVHTDPDLAQEPVLPVYMQRMDQIVLVAVERASGLEAPAISSLAIEILIAVPN